MGKYKSATFLTIVYESLAVLIIMAAMAYFFALSTGFAIYASGVPGGRSTTPLFLPTPFIFLCLYLLLTKISQLKTSTGPWRLMITMIVGITVQFALCGVAFVFYQGIDKYFQHAFPGYLMLITWTLFYALFAAVIGVLVWLPEKIVSLITGWVRQTKLP